MTLNRCARGQNLTEYSIGIALIAVVASFGLVSLGNSINHGFNSILGEKSDRKLATLSYKQQPQAGAQQTASNSSPAADTSGTVLKNMATQSSQGDRIQVSGSNGDSSKIYANTNQLLELAEKYENISPEVSNFILRLAEKGFTLASQLDNTLNATMLSISARRSELVATDQEFKDMSAELLNTPEFKQLSEADQKLISSLCLSSQKAVESSMAVINMSASIAGMPVSSTGGGADPVSGALSARKNMSTIESGQTTTSGTNSTTTTSKQSSTTTSNQTTTSTYTSKNAQKVNENSSQIANCSDGDCNSDKNR
jgi:hypothetical protein